MSKKSGRNQQPAKVATQPSPQRTVTQVAMQSASWQGPLPPPSQLAQFDAVVPGCAERIIRMAEQEGEHAREVQMRAVKATVIGQYLGQAFALVLAASAMVASYLLAMSGHDGVAAILGGTTLTTVVLAFLQRKRDDS